MADIIVCGVMIDGKAVLMCDGIPYRMELFRPELPIVEIVVILKQVARDNRNRGILYEGLHDGRDS
jgi:hypothetical protein